MPDNNESSRGFRTHTQDRPKGYEDGETKTPPKAKPKKEEKSKSTFGRDS